MTLTEVVVVMILGTLIMAGLVEFYLSSQGLWLDASTQAITQREATLVTTTIRDSIRVSASDVVSASPDSLHQQLALYSGNDPAPYYCFWWNPADSLIYSGRSTGAVGSGPMIISHAERFQFLDSRQAVRVDLRLRSAGGDVVEAGAYAVKMNRDSL